MSSDAERWASNRRYRAGWPPSDKQLRFIAELLDGLPGTRPHAPATRAGAAQLISQLLALRRRARFATSRRSQPR